MLTVMAFLITVTFLTYRPQRELRKVSVKSSSGSGLLKLVTNPLIRITTINDITIISLKDTEFI